MSKSRFVHKGDFLLTNSMSFGRPYITQVEGCIHDGWLVISLIGGAYCQDFYIISYLQILPMPSFQARLLELLFRILIQTRLLIVYFQYLLKQSKKELYRKLSQYS
ncbi:Uncharacterised protein [Phocaeicola vulgatus]|nr:Uncharacterised protein [Phocaeicola vulgatus]